MKYSDVPIFCCLCCHGGLEIDVFQAGKLNGTVEEGVLWCPSCKMMFLISGGIILLIDMGYCDDFDVNAFAGRWKGKFDFDGFKLYRGEICSSKMKQIEFFNADCNEYQDNVENSNFWKAVDANIFDSWLREIPESCSVLDIGCGAGRCTIPVAQTGRHIVGTDLSLSMLRKAAEKAEAGGVGDITFFLSDAERLPLRPDVFSAIISYGVLHHVEHPSTILETAKQILTNDGVFYALENHASTVRFIFDWMMHICKLWDEEAGNHPLFKESELQDFCLTSGLIAETELHIYLPPHLINKMGHSMARKFLRITDEICSRIPLIKDFGGQVVLKARKEKPPKGVRREECGFC